MKLIGALLALAGCGALGVMSIRMERRHIRALEALCGALALIQTELSTRLAPVPMLCEQLSRRANGVACAFFKALAERLDMLGRRELSELWRECAEQTLTELSSNELNEFISLGLILGRGELEVQLSAVRRCENALADALSSVSADYPRRRKLALGVAAAAGGLIVIVLI